jgi:hypothetical protein
VTFTFSDEVALALSMGKHRPDVLQSPAHDLEALRSGRARCAVGEVRISVNRPELNLDDLRKSRGSQPSLLNTRSDSNPL